MNLQFVYWFTFYNLDSPTVRYRGKFPLDYLKSHYGIDSYFVVPGYKPSNVFNFLRAWISALLFPKKNSVIVLQSINSNFIYSNALKLLVRFRRKQTIYDLDDADYLRFPPETILYFIKNCARVTVGSSELVKNISVHNKNTQLITCPTPDLDLVKNQKNEIFTIGWIGDLSTGHKQSLLESFFPALRNLPFRVKLVLLGVAKQADVEFLTNYFKEFNNLVLEIPQKVDWQNEIEIQNHIMNFDVGIATLLDNEFFRSKSAFKTKQCFNNGVPVLSSNIPENNVFVVHGKNGFLCDSHDDFRNRLIEIQGMNKEKYSELSKAARASISGFNLTHFCDEFIRLFHENNQQN